MKHFRNAILCILCVSCLSGCALMEITPQSADSAGQAVTSTVDQAEPVIGALENATGPVLTESQKSTGVKVAGTIQTVANTGSAIASSIPGGQGVGVALGLVGTIAGAIGTLISRRKTKQMAKAAVKAAEMKSGAGSDLSKTAAAAGVANEIREAYVKEVLANA